MADNRQRMRDLEKVVRIVNKMDLTNDQVSNKDEVNSHFEQA